MRVLERRGNASPRRMILAGERATARRHRTRLTVHCWPFRRFSTRREEVEKSTTPAGLRHILHVQGEAGKRKMVVQIDQVDFLTSPPRFSRVGLEGNPQNLAFRQKPSK